MPDPITPPEWLTVGATVVISSVGGGTIMRRATVDKITATTVVVDGQRFRLDRLTRHPAYDGGEYTTSYILAPTDPRALAHFAARRRRRLAINAAQLVKAWADDPTRIDDVRAAFAAILDNPTT